MVTTLSAYFHPPTKVSNVFTRNGTYPLMFIGRIYNIQTAQVAVAEAANCGFELLPHPSYPPD